MSRRKRTDKKIVCGRCGALVSLDSLGKKIFPRFQQRTLDEFFIQSSIG